MALLEDLRQTSLELYWKDQVPRETLSHSFFQNFLLHNRKPFKELRNMQWNRVSKVFW